jgi:hypothetical protein
MHPARMNRVGRSLAWALFGVGFLLAGCAEDRSPDPTPPILDLGTPWQTTPFPRRR